MLDETKNGPHTKDYSTNVSNVCSVDYFYL